MDFDLEQVDFYKFRDEKEFDSYLRGILKTDIGKPMGAVSGNITLLLVNQEHERVLKVFPWNQILMSSGERMELAGMFYDFYHDSLHQLCRCRIYADDPSVKQWGDLQISWLPGLFDILETEGYYPVFAQTCAADSNDDKGCYLECICVIDKSKQ